ncbi:F-box/kelch-repeat protein SKIP6 [Malania oleifera]|uniref:F-box/kelch-repeat protein SKIP6 n=1 Tax=Malania oleifera TaxID=397392 RepID=UPI0025AE4616|nr:F-box/kelch-repeat protein SKIP6 [Malania oleifera]
MADQTSSSGDPLPPLLIPGLPNDVALQCIARVPLVHHPTLSAVSKSWRSLLRSPLLFATRSRLNCSRPFLFINIRVHRSSKWFALLQSSSTLSPLPPLPSAAVGSAVAVVGPKIFVIGGCVNDIPSPDVWIFDTISNRWDLGQRMRVGREFAAAGVVAGKVYVIGGCVVDSWARSANWAEVFDPDLGSWAGVPSPVEVKEKWMHASAVVGNRIFAMADRGGVTFDPVTAAWAAVSPGLDMGWRGRAAVVNGVLYCYDYLGRIRGYDVEKDVWMELRGVDKGLPKFLCGATMANVGGKLVVVWEDGKKGKEMEIACAEVEVRREGDGQLWGSIVWSSSVLSAPAGSSIIHCLAVEQ